MSISIMVQMIPFAFSGIDLFVKQIQRIISH